MGSIISKIIKSSKVVVSCLTEPDGEKMHSGDNRWCQIVLHFTFGLGLVRSCVQERLKAGVCLKPGARVLRETNGLRKGQKL